MKSLTITVCAAILGFGCSSPQFTQRSGRPMSVAPAHGQAIGIVRVPKPWYAPRFLVVGKFVDAVPEFEAVTGLDNKYFTIADDGRYGGIYVWQSRADADAFYSEKWRARIRDQRGADPDLLMLETHLLIDGTADITGDPVGSRSVKYPGTACLFLWSSDEPSAAVERLAASRLAEPGLIRAYVISGSDRRVGLVSLWATRELAEAAHSPAKLAALQGGASTSGEQVLYFDAPVLIDELIRKAGSSDKLAETAGH